MWMELEGITLNEISLTHRWRNKFHRWNIRNGAEGHRRREGKLKSHQREKSHGRLLILGNSVAGGEAGVGWGNWVMGIKEDMWYDEHWLLYTTDKSLHTTSETKYFVLANWFKLKKKKKSPASSKVLLLPRLGMISLGRAVSSCAVLKQSTKKHHWSPQPMKKCPAISGKCQYTWVSLLVAKIQIRPTAARLSYFTLYWWPLFSSEKKFLIDLWSQSILYSTRLLRNVCQN